MKRRGKKIWVFILFLIGLLIFLYPAVSNWYNHRVHYEQIEGYRRENQAQDESYRAGQLALAQAWNEKLYKGVRNEAIFSDANLKTRAEASAELPDIAKAEGTIMGFVQIPAIAVELPIYYGISDPVLSRGVGYMPSTSLPVGGKNTHAALTGHRGLPEAELFRYLDHLEKGDGFFLEILGKRMAYQVDAIKTVAPTDATDLMIQPGQDLVTLVTCDPYMRNTDRLLVRGRRVDYDFDDQAAADLMISAAPRLGFWDKHRDELWLLLGLGLLLTCWLFVVWRRDKRRKAAVKPWWDFRDS